MELKDGKIFFNDNLDINDLKKIIDKIDPNNEVFKDTNELIQTVNQDQVNTNVNNEKEFIKKKEDLRRI